MIDDQIGTLAGVLVGAAISIAASSVSKATREKPSARDERPTAVSTVIKHEVTLRLDPSAMFGQLNKQKVVEIPLDVKPVLIEAITAENRR